LAGRLDRSLPDQLAQRLAACIKADVSREVTRAGERLDDVQSNDMDSMPPGKRTGELSTDLSSFRGIDMHNKIFEAHRSAYRHDD
jgi:hypothetical protein